MKPIFMKARFFPTVFIILLIITSLHNPLVQSKSSTVQLNKTLFSSIDDCVNEWSDGVFDGTWMISADQQGMIHGDLCYRRTDKNGVFQGELMLEDNVVIGEYNGWFFNHLIIGVLRYSQAIIPVPFVGRFNYTNDGFSAFIYLNLSEHIRITGTYTASFLPPLTGSYGVGVKQYHLVDTNRPEYFTSEVDDYREMMIQIWYPTEKETIDPYADYMDPSTFLWLKTQSPIPLFTIPNNAYQFINPHFKQNNSLVSYSSSFPIIIFSHGYDGVYQIYTSFIEDLVSHGFVVVSINHPYVAGITVFPDGRTVSIASVPDEQVQDFFNMSLRSVIEDAKYVIDYVSLLNQTSNFWQGRLDVSKVGMFGHSFGGAATAVCCMEDNRFKAGLTLDGVFYPGFLENDIFSPMLMMFTKGRYQEDDGADFLWDQLKNDAYKIGITGSEHYSYTDVGLLLKHLTPLLPPKLLGFGSIPPKRMVNISRQIELAFFDVYLRNGDQDQLNSLFDVYDELLVTKKSD